MLLAATICMLSASLVLAVVDCFLKKNKAISFLLQLFMITALFCTSITILNLKNDFSLFGIIASISILPQLFATFDMKDFLKSKKRIKIEAYLKDFQEKPQKASKFWQSSISLNKCVALLLSCVLLSICGLILGIESIFIYLLAVAIASLLAFIVLAVKKNINVYDLFSNLMAFLAIGLAFAQILSVLVFSINVINLVYAGSMLLFAVYAVLTTTKFNFSSIFYLLSVFALFATIMI